VVHPDIVADRKVRAPQFARKRLALPCANCGFPSVVVLNGPEGWRLVCRHCTRSNP
jgi:hypothetical protein